MLTLFKPSTVRDRDDLVYELARQVAAVTLPRLAPTAAQMAAAELRGYLRTRVTSEARAQVARAVAERHCRSNEIADLVTTVTERAIHLMIRDLSAPPVVATPSPHIASRRAA
jgi:hypothetical protein